MAKKIQILPAILAYNLEQFKQQWQKVAKDFKSFQIDILDTDFVDSKNNLNPRTIKSIIKTAELEIHLMVKDINSYLGPWANFKNTKKIIWHYEATQDLDDINTALRWLKKNKIKAGLAINPKTKLKFILPLVKKFDTILIMGVEPGQMGQTFNKKVLSKIKKLRKKFPNLNIEVDGGINATNYQKIIKAGANLIVMGKYLQKADNLKTALNQLK